MRSWNILSLRCVDRASLPGLQPDVWEIDIRELIQGAPIRHFMSIAYIVFRYHKNITFFVPFRNRHHQNAVTDRMMSENKREHGYVRYAEIIFSTKRKRIQTFCVFLPPEKLNNVSYRNRREILYHLLVWDCFYYNESL